MLLFFALAELSGAVGRSAFVAAVFAVHPLHVESVAWATERKDVVSGVFFMLSLLAYARYAARRSGGRYAVVLLCVAAGLLAKPTLVTLPFVLLLLDFWPLQRLGRGALLEKLPLLLLAAGVSGATYLAQAEAGAGAYGAEIPLTWRLANAVDAYAVYLWKSLWPTGLAAFYPHPLDSLPAWRVVVGLALLAAISAAALALRRRSPYVLVGWLWYLGMLVPMIGIVQVGEQARADRYTYLPQVGLAIALAWGVVDLAGDRARRKGLAAVGALVVVALAVVANRQVTTWRNSLALFEHARAVTAESFFVHLRLATAHLRAGRLADAERHYRRGFALDPERGRSRLVHFHLGMAHEDERRGDAEAEMARYRAVLAIVPDHPRANARLGLALVGRGRASQARSHLELALAAEPSAGLHAALASVASAEGRLAEAVTRNRAALALDPGLRSARNNLAWILATAPDPALREPAEAVRLAAALARERPDANQLDTLGAAYAAAGRWDDAVRSAEQAVALAENAGETALAAALARRLARFRRGEIWIDPPAGEP
ncbi:MAG: hypothetical protein QNK04_22240 [Myxococcota bacterium]|nr:hypothetical protein [Myxococcota bacterium]